MAEPSTTQCNVRGTSIKLMRARPSAATREPLLLLRGTDASDDWLPYMDELAARFDVIVPEHPGFGGKPMPRWLDCVGDLANFYLDLIDVLALGRVHVVGTSLGGWIAADMAHRYSDKFATLTLVGAAGIRIPQVDGIDLFMRSEEQALQDRFHDLVIADAVSARMLTAANEDVRLANAITTARVAWNPRLHDPQLAKWLHRIQVPTAIVWGEHDRILPVAYARAFEQAIPGASVSIVRGCGHAVALERPDAFVAAIYASTRRGRPA